MKNIWWISTNPYIDRYYNRYKHKQEKDFFKVRYCNMCNNSWESVYNINSKRDGRNVEIKYYPDFPTYGLKRVRCPSCGNE